VPLQHGLFCAGVCLNLILSLKGLAAVRATHIRLFVHSLLASVFPIVKDWLRSLVWSRGGEGCLLSTIHCFRVCGRRYELLINIRVFVYNNAARPLPPGVPAVHARAHAPHAGGGREQRHRAGGGQGGGGLYKLNPVSCPIACARLVLLAVRFVQLVSRRGAIAPVCASLLRRHDTTLEPIK
jgi:hypothetical protein